MLGLIMWGACSSSGRIASTKDEVIPLSEVFALLEEAVEKSIEGDVGAALAVCDEALEQFESDVEPSLLQACGRVCTTAIEYRLGSLRKSIQTQSDTQKAILEDVEKKVVGVLKKDD